MSLKFNLSYVCPECHGDPWNGHTEGCKSKLTCLISDSKEPYYACPECNENAFVKHKPDCPILLNKPKKVSESLGE